MHRHLFIAILAVVALMPLLLLCQDESRFGFEYNEIGLWISPHHQQLLDVLALSGATGGNINVNAVGGGWYGMQPVPGGSIDFSQTDQIVELFQARGFALAWNVSPNAPWAFPNKPACQPDTVGGLVFPRNCAPEPGFEDDWIDFISALVERYDGDGIDDMPGLQIASRIYIMTGEVKFASLGEGDSAEGPFWFDSIDNLLRLHRITYAAVHEADTSSLIKLVSSGGLLTDLYADFPDYPEYDPDDPNSLIQQRLGGNNWSGNLYTAGWDSLKKMLVSFGDDSDGIEADYVGWHPHFGWRVIDQEFALIRALTNEIPIFVDDMWTNIFSEGRGLFNQFPPGRMQFIAPPQPGGDLGWLAACYGDFPNELFPGDDPHKMLKEGLQVSDPEILRWYYGNGAREAVKAFVSAFGEGAISAAYSGTNDLAELRALGPTIGWLNLLGTRAEAYAEKPQFYACQQMIDLLIDFTSVNELAAGTDPRTRLYEFERAQRGPVLVGWSETGPPPPGLDYSVPNGETVTIDLSTTAVNVTQIISDSSNSSAQSDTFDIPGGQFTIQLGHSPVYLEPIEEVRLDPKKARIQTFALFQNYPNPFNPITYFGFRIADFGFVNITVFDVQGALVRNIISRNMVPGEYTVQWDGTNDAGEAVASGIYFYTLVFRSESGQPGSGLHETRKMLLTR